jgi:solute carrier family 6 amino acid transporter-like protein 5/7/9/14
MSVGLGNIWRFPFTAYENGGGAFLIPYILVLLLIGKPLYYMEMSIGQFSSCGPVKCWQAVPALKGIGVGQSFATFLVNSYYVSLIALTLHYMIKSFAAELPWAKCWDSWSVDNCIDSEFSRKSNESSNGTFYVSSSEHYFM